MKRRDHLKLTFAWSAAGAFPWALQAENAATIDDRFPSLAAAALGRATQLGASYADFRIVQMDHEGLYAREEMVQGIDASASLGVSVRVLCNGAWGFAAAGTVDERTAIRLAGDAVAMARAQAAWQKVPVEIETLPAYQDRWEMPHRVDPFALGVEEKTGWLLDVNRAALRAGANFCSAGLHLVRERKWLANTFGSRLAQSRLRVHPTFNVTVLDEKQGGFASRASLEPPRGAGYEYVQEAGMIEEAARAVAEAKEKLVAPSVTPGRMDLVIAPSNLWLTIHETVGHPTELDRALGFEANFAGTSFCTPDKLGKLQYADERVTIRADRTQRDGLATVAYDDDGVKTAGKEFDIIGKGRFENYQMALGQARLIGRTASNGCAYADSSSSFPIQRMPNISLQPGPDDAVTAESLIAEVENGLYVVGNGSWSIDQQRYNFQFTGQVFQRIRHGRLAGMVKDVAYQGNSVDFWNACDGLGGAASYELGGAFNCGKGQPQQVAPVSHGAVPARFRGINVLNTNQEAGRPVAALDCSCCSNRQWI